MQENTFKIFSDGGSRGNPGPSAIGVVVNSAQGKQIATISKTIGDGTNNIAEYSAVLEAINWLLQNTQSPQVEFYLDSELVCKQLNGEYKVKDENLKKLYFKIREGIVSLGGKISFSHIRREQNAQADALVNEALDSEYGKRNLSQTS
jgi:ribonuclease HI